MGCARSWRTGPPLRTLASRPAGPWPATYDLPPRASPLGSCGRRSTLLTPAATTSSSRRKARVSSLSDVSVARTVAAEAGDALLALRAAAGDAPDLRARADAAAQAVIADLLARLRPGDAVLSEEALDDPARLTARR